MSASHGGGINLGTATTMRVALGPSGMVVAGWFRPSSLTSGRTLWCFNDTSTTQTELTINGTAGSLSLRVRRATTDRLLTTPTGNIAANTWSFICLTLFGQSTVNESIWVGSESSIPVSQTLTVSVGGSGNIINAYGFTLGADASGGSTFPGLTSQVSLLCMRTDVNNIKPDDEYIFTRYVYPLYEGSFDSQNLMTAPNGNVVAMGNEGGLRYLPLDSERNGSSGNTFPFYEYSSGFAGTVLGSMTNQSQSTTATYSSVEPSSARMNALVTNGFQYPLLARR